MSTTATVKLLVGRKIVAFDPGTERVGRPVEAKTMHDFKITLDNGAVLFGSVEENPEGGDYGVELRYHRPRKV